MSVTYVIDFNVRPGCTERFRTLIDKVLDSMRHEANFRNAALHQDPDDPHHFLLYESWADHQDVLEVQLERPYRAEWHAALPEILSKPRGISIWKPLRADGAFAQTECKPAMLGEEA